MPDVSVRGGVPAVKRPVRAPLAITSDGDVLLNVAELMDGPERERLLREAVRTNAPVFIGVRLTTAEIDAILEHVDNALAETVGRLVGHRRRRLVTRSKRTTRS